MDEKDSGGNCDSQPPSRNTTVCLSAVWRKHRNALSMRISVRTT